ncbi:MAG TPA: hypothetical protein VMV25_09150 [Steroidobacteraceae bacterium]|nr:hypothetical protein [Steroidobacteraceae bacterium]
MVRFLTLLLLCAGSANVYAAGSPVDIDTAAQVYLAAGVRQQVRASLGAMPAKMRQMFTSQTSATLSAAQLAAVTAAARKGFQIAVFEPPALAALAANLDPLTVKNSLAFLASGVGTRMVKADIALAELPEATIDKVANGTIAAPSTSRRDALFKKMEAAAQSTESAVQIYVGIGRSLAIGTALGSGMDLETARHRVAKTDTAADSLTLARSLEIPLGRYLAYGYRGLRDADLRKLLSFLQSASGKVYVKAYIAAMSAGFEAMAQRTGERIGESWRELAEARVADAELLAPQTAHAPAPASAPAPAAAPGP